MEVSSAELEFITKLVAAVIVPTDKTPTVPATTEWVSIIMLLAVTAVVLIVMLPAVIEPEMPADAFEPVAIFILLPAVSNARFPVISTLSVGAVVAPKPNAPTWLLIVEAPVW